MGKATKIGKVTTVTTVTFGLEVAKMGVVTDGAKIDRTEGNSVSPLFSYNKVEVTVVTRVTRLSQTLYGCMYVSLIYKRYNNYSYIGTKGNKLGNARKHWPFSLPMRSRSLAPHGYKFLLPLSQCKACFSFLTMLGSATGVSYEDPRGTSRSCGSSPARSAG